MSGTIVVTTGKEASAAVVRLVEMSTEQAERLVEEATEDANRIREEANRTRTSAHHRCSDPSRASRVGGSGQCGTASGRCAQSREKLDREIEGRRGEMFGDLEQQRDDLTAAVAALRNFEAAYRTNLTRHLRGRSRRWSLADGASRYPGRVRGAQPGRGRLQRDGSVG